jgi:serine protease Do
VIGWLVLVSITSIAQTGALEQAAPAVVRIETAGGDARIASVGAGVTTGVVIDPAGLILTSTFALANNPAGILVLLPGGKTLPARKLGVDHRRMVALLAVDATNLPVIQPALPQSIRVGQNVFALGRVWKQDLPSASRGILSATDRLWGRALQTDAKISPVNYGGPLIDRQGRMLGLVVPFDISGDARLPGVAWYDSGIGFAIPIADILADLPLLKAGDIEPGLTGLAFTPGDPVLAPAVLARPAWRSPAENAGLRIGDTVLAIDDHPVRREADLLHRLVPKKKGDDVALTVRRDQTTLDATLKLAPSLPAYRWPALGITTADTPEGLRISRVLSRSPAQSSSLTEGDYLLAINGQPMKDSSDLRDRLDEMESIAPVSLRIRRDSRSQDITITPVPLGSLQMDTSPAAVPTSLERRSTARLNVEYVVQGPSQADSHRWGLLLVLEPTAPRRDAVFKRWQSVASARRLALIAPTPAMADTWSTADFPRIRDVVDDALSQGNFDRRRVLSLAGPESAPMPVGFLRSARDVITGVIGINAFPIGLGPTHPGERLAIFAIWSEKDKRSTAWIRERDRLVNLGYPVFGGPEAILPGAYPQEDLLRRTAAHVDLLDVH